jgi:hypothetical protein
MSEIFKSLYKIVTSMKVWTAVIVGGLIAGMHAAGVSDKVIEMITAIGGVLIGAQGMGDFGKYSPKQQDLTEDK